MLLLTSSSPEGVSEAADVFSDKDSEVKFMLEESVASDGVTADSS